MSSGVPRINRASKVPRPPHPINPTRSLSLAPKTRLADAAVHAAIPAFIDFFTKSRRSMVGPCRSGISRSCYRQQDIINSLQMPTTRLRIGFVGCVHPFYDLPPVARQRQDAIEELRRAGCEVIAAETPRTAADAVEVAARLRLAGTAFFVTPSVAEAVFMSNRILVMSANRGRLQEELRVDLPYPR